MAKSTREFEANKKWKSLGFVEQGGQGLIYKVSSDDGSQYALKLVKAKLSQSRRIKRIQQEISIMKKLDGGAHIAKIYDDNSDSLKEGVDQEFFYVMDFATHGSLRNNNFYIGDLETSLKLFRQIVAGVKYAHENGVIHRDLKPENILFYPNQRSIIVSDFGLGLLKDQPTEKKISEQDEVVGPMFFMAPEQFKKSAEANERSDIYSMGKILFFMLTGKGKVFREEIGELKEYFSGSNPYLPLVQEKLIGKMVATDPKNRYSSADEVLEEIDQLLSKIEASSHRSLKKSRQRFAMYEIIEGDGLDKFVQRFSRDLTENIEILEWIVSDLVRDDKNARLTLLRTRLEQVVPRGKSAAALKAVFTYVENPDELKTIDPRKTYSFSPFYQAMYFENADYHEEAHKLLEEAIAKETNETLKLRYLLELAKICERCKCSRPHDADARIKKLLQSATDIQKRIDIYKVLGDHYINSDKNDKKIEGLRFLEAYLFEKPSDSQARFKCAYEYSNLDQPSLALYHYLLYKKTCSKEENYTVDNNLGVLYEQNSMPIKAMKRYASASDHGETLATSNIASKYLGIGLIDEARVMLRQAILDHPDGTYDERVDNVLGNISNRVDEENTTEDEMTKKGELISRYNAASIRSLTKPALDWVGDWEFVAGTSKSVVKLSRIAGSTFEATSARKDWELKLEIKMNIGTISKYKPDNNTYKSYDYGVLYFVNTNKIEGYAVGSNGDIQEIHLERIADLAKYQKDHPSNYLNDFLRDLRGN